MEEIKKSVVKLVESKKIENLNQLVLIEINEILKKVSGKKSYAKLTELESLLELFHEEIKKYYDTNKNYYDIYMIYEKIKELNN
jgi:hypothetical protein